MKIIAPYGIRFNADWKIEVMPVVEIKISAAGDQSFLGIFVVDSGASVSLSPASDAEILGLKWKTGKRIYVRGISGRQLMGYRCGVDMGFGEFVLRSVPVIFTERKDVPRVLGREGVFSKFGILFDESKRKTVLFDVLTERKKLDDLAEE